MIKSLVVRNFAIIDNIQIDFSNGMTVLTGETGAGKSLIIDAISLLFGERASLHQVRHNETKAFIEGVFVDYSKKVDALLDEFGIEKGEFLVIKREIFSTGKSISKVNGEVISLSNLYELSQELGDIHTQFDAIKLVNPKNYFDYIDSDESKIVLNEYILLYKEYKKVNMEYLEKFNNAFSEKQKIDFLKFQLDELKKANLNFDEELTLQEEVKKISNFEKIKTNFEEFKSLFDKTNLLSNLYNSIKAIKENEVYDKNLEKYIKILDESYLNITDCYDEVNKYYFEFDFDSNYLEEINNRLGVYSSLKRKYKLTTEELIELKEKLEVELNNLENYDFNLEELDKKRNLLYKKTEEIAIKLSNIRKENAKILKNEMEKVFEELMLKNTLFEIKFETSPNESYFKPNGIDLIDFYVSFNIGENLKPLNKVASGGELSRFMLALKAVSSLKIDPKTFIFDEIDSFVSGEVAYSIASKMINIAKYHQVLCVTHLPQVASISNNHLFITKEVINEKTVSHVIELDKEKRAYEIAKMISDGSVSESALSLAYELLNKN